MATPGCVRRLLEVRSEPGGASVYLDGRAVGTTPLRVPFVHYGTRELVVRHPERATRRAVVRLHPPWWQIPPFDLLTELLYPGTLVDLHRVELALPPRRRGTDDLERLLERAQAARDGTDVPAHLHRPGGKVDGREADALRH